MVIKNPWVGYLDRSYNSVKASILGKLKTEVPEVTDYSESNILVIIISIFAGVAEMLNYYIDSMARESFLNTARKWDSVWKITRLINYRVRSSISASVDLTFTCLDSNGDPVALASGKSITIPKDTQITTSTGVSFLTTRVGYITEGLYHITIPAKQQTIVSKFTKGTSNGTANQTFALPTSFDDGTLYVEVGGVTWDYKEHLGWSGVTDNHYTVEVGESGIPYLTFGDNTHGKIPTNGASIAISYRTTLGTRGNLSAHTITDITTVPNLPSQSPAVASLEVDNINASSGGLNVEDIERIRKSAPLSLRTLDKAVTRQDYVDIAKLSPSVDKAAVLFNCGKRVIIYVSPIGGGIASSAILNDTKAFVEARKIIGLNIETYAAGETYIGATITATAKFRVNTNLVEADIQKALIDAYSSENSDINLPIRTSDIISLLDNLEKVDYLDLVKIYAVPYARPILHALELDWDRTIGDGSVTEQKWRIIVSGLPGSPIFKLYKGGTQVKTLVVAETYTYGTTLTLTINSVPAGAVNGNTWEFTTYPINKDIILNDYTMPRVHPSFNYINLTVNEQSY